MNHTNLRKTSGLSRAFNNIILIVMLLLLIFPLKRFADVRPVQAHGDDGHSHVRFAHITWISGDNDPVNAARITFTAGFRRNAYSTCKNPLTGGSVSCSGPGGLPGEGDIILEDVGGTTIDNFGDGTSISTTLYFKVFSINVPDNWLMARALQPGTANQEYIFHQYTGTGPYIVVSESCCRTGFLAPPNAHINNPDESYRFSALIDFSKTTAGPISLLPPIVDCPLETECNFKVAAVDPDAFDPEDPNPTHLRWRFASAQEMGGPTLSPIPPGATIDPESGVITWTPHACVNPSPPIPPNCFNFQIGYNNLFSTQVVIEDTNAANGHPEEIKSSVVVDFFIRVVKLPSPPTGKISIPVRWCGLIGSPSVDNPSQNSDFATLEEILDHRLANLSASIYVPRAQIKFISTPREQGYPIFANTNVDGDPGYGNFRKQFASLDLHRAINDCRLKWQETNPEAPGLIAINFRRFVDGSGNDTTGFGVGMGPDYYERGIPGYQLVSGASVRDNASLTDPNQKWLGHEIGHALSLTHALDDPLHPNYDPLFSQIVDRRYNLMNQDQTDAQTIEDIQRTVIRIQALMISGASEEGSSSSPRGGTRADAVMDVPAGEAFVDVDTTGIAISPDQSTTHFVVSTFGLFPENASGLNYYFAADLDNQSSTGGSPSDVGAPYTAQGMDVVGLVQVDVVNGVAQGTPTVWKYQNGQYVQLTDSRIQTIVDTVYGREASQFQTVSSDAAPVAQIIQLLIPNDLLGSVATQVRLATVAKNSATGTVDSVEGPIYLTSPTLPSCQVNPDGALLGSTVNINASNLLANRSISVYLGDQAIASGSTDSSGNATLDATIPTNTITGTQIVYVHVVGTGVSAFCEVQLWATPKFDVPPSPTDGTSFTVNVGETLQIPIQASDLDTGAGDVVTLDAIGLPAGASFPISSPANPASATFSWTPTSDQAGSYVVVFTARDSLGLSGTPLSIIINVQSTPTACTPSNTYGSLRNGGAKFASLTAQNITNFNRLPLSFVPNRGQEDQAVRFHAQGLGGKLFFTPNEVVFSLPNPVKEDDKDKIRYDRHPANVVRIHYQGANDNPDISGTGALPGVVNVLKGNNPSKWRTNLPTYSGIAYRELYPGIELRYDGIDGQLKSTFQVTPGADPSAIVWRYKGASDLNVDEFGNLVINLPEPAGNGAVLVEQAPIAWQGVGENRVMVAVQYAVSNNDKKVSFTFPNGYDSTLPLIIDPTLTYSTYLGGGTTDQGQAITLDADCNIYLTGVTYSTNFPTETPIQTNQPGSDVFVSKLNSAGNTVLYSTYLGGGGSDHAWGINRDSQGTITIVGETESNNFPTMNAYQTTYAGGTCSDGPCDDVFVTQLLADGSALRYSSYFGGSGDDEAYGIALGADDMVYLTGLTKSSTFPTTANGYNRTFGGGTCSGYPCEDVFVSQVNPALSGANSLLYSTFLGGSNYDKGRGIALDASGRVYVAGFTRSDNYPTLNPYQAARAGNSDVFVTKLDTTLSGAASLLYSTYLGGSGSEHAYGLALNGANQVYLTGYTQSTNFPLANPFDNTFGGGTCGGSACYDAYVTHLDIANNILVSSSYLGGGNEEQGAGITVDGNGNTYVTGYTKSTNFNTLAAIQASKAADSCSAPPCADAFVTKVSSAGALVYSTYLGGTAEDYGNAIVVDGLGNTYIVGHTFSSNFPGAINPFTGTAGYADAFVVKIED